MKAEIKPYATVELDLDQETTDKLNQLAEEKNMSVDCLINHLLIDMVSKEINVEDIKDINILDVFDNNPDIKYWLIKKNGVPIWRVTPV